MRRLYGLPSRGLPDGLTDAEKADIRRAEIENFMSALKGVSAYALSEAVERIMQNALGHKWMPLPPELRGLCDEIMRPILEARARDRREAEILKEQHEEKRQREHSQSTWTPESRQRASAKWKAIKAQMQAEGAKDDVKRDQYDVSAEACMARLQAAAEANGHEFNIDNLTSAPSGSFKQVGKAA
ncbi:hypothetical protein [Brucella sp. NBRC 113783]|uniref:hypothetical protein n=1 Tax=Brucella sp. NBRC 113783 TaxID=3075478 RepID=UPI0029BFF806|nr:hypothetical protein [Brucella sp. NBRC 113783]MDX4072530.1 hypothetical protein [Brucella sp. NBRC 113783]